MKINGFVKKVLQRIAAKYCQGKYMKLYFALFALLIFANSCDKIRGCRPAKHSYTFQTDKYLDTTRSNREDPVYQYYTYQINSGSNLLFEYLYEFEDCPNIADDEGTQRVIFEVPANTDQFSFTDSLQLKQAKVMLVMSCECIPYMPVFFKKGTIEGKRINETKWQITANLEVPGRTNQGISFNKAFDLK